MAWTWWLWVVLAYGCGSVPFGFLLGKARGVDIRQVGSGNVGASNLGRALARRWGIVCFALDVLKGAAPVWAAGWTLGYLCRTTLPEADLWQWLAVAVAAVLGHMFPVWLAFRGGKGVATGFGVLLGVWPIFIWPALVAVLIWIAIIGLLRYIGLASMVAAGSLPITIAVIAAVQCRSMHSVRPALIVSAALAVLVVVRHRGNIARLLAGTEPKIGQPL